MTAAVSAICSAILLLAAGFHIYWGFGGRMAAGVALPQRQDGSPVIENAAFGAIAVGLIMTLLFLLVLARTGVVRLPVPQAWLTAGIALWAIVFTVRALSWSRYVGLFKQVRTTRFARYDTLLYSPLCLVLGLGFFYLALADSAP
ncbi:DUF3995 domain-containing protein [Mesorhizobium sp. INR15]|uniref:DUF3995 domain-containing protein n=1 Tax=Mesorhizobium sp. INR15 TaxID=2654248 RepID=UPI00189671AE|nr:DUF3995 domain-containing protein [Mesorhizobium sp. INR15]QPC92733.1 DUF3995 domain-containing protein [Mesorhizobium sp. INR15]